MRKKGQMSSGEIVLAYFIFFIALTAAVTLWMDSSNRIQGTNRFTDFENTASDAAEKLIRTKGIPENWTEEDVSTIGLANEPMTLDNGKLIAFVKLMNDTEPSTKPGCSGISNYECNKELIGIGAYNFNFTILNLDGSPVQINNVTIVAGRNPVDVTDQLTLTRPVIVNNNVTKMVITFWYVNGGPA